MNRDGFAKSAVVLSGGGAKGAYEIGVMKALFEGESPATGFQPIDPEIVTGTSVGAYNAAYLASRFDVSARQAVAELEEIWRRRVANTAAACGNGVYRLRGLPLDGLDLSCLTRPLDVFFKVARDSVYLAGEAFEHGGKFLTSGQPLEVRALRAFDLSAFFDVTPLEGLVRDTIDLDALRRSPKKLEIAATNWRTGALKVFSREEIVERALHKAVLASAAIPAVFPPVEVEGETYVDGGLRLNTPLRPAVREGARHAFVIYVDPELADVPLAKPPNTLDAVYRMYSVTVANKIAADIRRAANLNQTLELLERGPGAAAPSRQAVTDLLGHVESLRSRIGEGRPHHKLAVHRFRPATDLEGGVGLLDFCERFVTELIETGYRDAVGHDCATAGCTLPAGET